MEMLEMPSNSILITCTTYVRILHGNISVTLVKMRSICIQRLVQLVYTEQSHRYMINCILFLTHLIHCQCTHRLRYANVRKGYVRHTPCTFRIRLRRCTQRPNYFWTCQKCISVILYASVQHKRYAHANHTHVIHWIPQTYA